MSCGGGHLGFQISTKITRFVKNQTNLIRTILNLKPLYNFQTTELESSENQNCIIGSRGHVEF